MSQELQQSVINAMNNPKVAASVAAGTTATGAGTYLEWITPVLGVVATSVGIILSIVLIVAKIISTYLEFKLSNLKIKDFEEKHKNA